MILNFPAISAAGAVLPEGSFLSGGLTLSRAPKRLDAFLLGGGGGACQSAPGGDGGDGVYPFGSDSCLFQPGMRFGAGGGGGFWTDYTGYNFKAAGLGGESGNGAGNNGPGFPGSFYGAGGGGGKQIGGLNGWRGGDGCPGILILRSAQ